MMSYIGICDFPSGEQSLKSAQLFEQLSQGKPAMANRKLMVGVMMSFKTMMGLPSKWTEVWPKKEVVSGIFIDHQAVLNTLHYADYDCNTSVAHLVEAVEWGGQHLHALQLDMIWPPDVIVKGLRRKFPHLKVVLQVNTNALEIVENKPDVLVEWLRRYDGAVDYALLDKSHGKGIGMDANVLLPFARAIAEHLPNMGIAAGGGLGSRSLHLVEPLKCEIPNLSIDAQGQLRPSGNALDPIDWELAHSYLTQSVKMFS